MVVLSKGLFIPNVFSHCPLLPALVKVFFSWSSEYWRENGSITHSVLYSHRHHWHNPNFNNSNNGHDYRVFELLFLLYINEILF